jgi:TetR/AcrR family transcriptional repressor of lmrAB and yxaGH operons
MPNDTRQAMVDTAVRLFRTKGYAATSWRGLVTEAGTPWGSVQHHFPGGKAELAVAAVTVGQDQVLKAIEIGFAKHEDPADAIVWWIGKARAILERSDYTQGCPVVMLALEADTETVGTATRTAFERWRASLATHLADRGVDDPDGTALSVLLMVQGALVLGKSMRSSAPLDQVCDDVRRRLA